jgi:uncharacterized membrane protein YhaH (DUF805 family)
MQSFVVHFYFSPRGRTGRQAYWLIGLLPPFLLGVAIGFTYRSFGMSRDHILMLIALTIPVAWWVWIALGARRLHDIGLSSWWMVLVVALPMAVSLLLPEYLAQMPNLVVALVLGTVPGVVGSNRYGDDPGAKRALPVEKGG